MSRYILLVSTFLSAYTFKISTTVRCACNEHPAAICYMQTYCYWTGEQCVDLQCSYLSKRKCSSPHYSEFKCNWNANNQQCEEYTYKCSELLNDSDCRAYKDISCLNCWWDSNTSQCLDYSCTIAQDDCNKSICSYIDGICGDPQKLECSDCTDIIYLGNGDFCQPNDNQVCTYSSLNAACDDYSDNQILCDGNCMYDTENQKCVDPTCSLYKTLDDCYGSSITVNQTEIFCSWDNKCVEASEDQVKEQISKLTSYACINYLNYKTWDSDAQKCKICTDFVSQPCIANYELSSWMITISMFILVF